MAWILLLGSSAWGDVLGADIADYRNNKNNMRTYNGVVWVIEQEVQK